MEASERRTLIYALAEPLSGDVRYVGKTTQRLMTRVDCHVREARAGRQTHTARWVRSLLALAAKPAVLVLDEIPPGGDWAAAERHWIAALRLAGCDLTNHTDGGEGTTGWHHSIEVRQRMSQAHMGKIIPDELRARWADSKRGKRTRPPSEETRRKIGAAQKGVPRPSARRKQSDEARLKKSEAAIRRYQDPEQRRLTSEACKARFMKSKEHD